MPFKMDWYQSKYEKNPGWNALLFESKIYIYNMYHLVSPTSIHLHAILKKQFNMFNTKFTLQYIRITSNGKYFLFAYNSLR